MYETEFVCRCIKACWDFDISEGETYRGTAVFDKDGSVTFVITFFDEDCPLRCVQEWFKDYFELVLTNN